MYNNDQFTQYGKSIYSDYRKPHQSIKLFANKVSCSNNNQAVPV